MLVRNILWSRYRGRILIVLSLLSSFRSTFKAGSEKSFVSQHICSVKAESLSNTKVKKSWTEWIIHNCTTFQITKLLQFGLGLIIQLDLRLRVLPKSIVVIDCYYCLRNLISRQQFWYGTEKTFLVKTFLENSSRSNCRCVPKMVSVSRSHRIARGTGRKYDSSVANRTWKDYESVIDVCCWSAFFWYIQ